MNMPLCQPLQPQDVYSFQQCRWRARPRDRSGVPISTAIAVPFMMGSVSYPRQSNLKGHQNSPVVSSNVSTPVFSLFSSPDYVNPYGYTPTMCPVTHLDVPPTLDLYQDKSQGCTIPQRISCTLNLCSVQPACQSSPTTSSVSAIYNSSTINQPTTSASSLSYDQTEKVKNVHVQKEEKLWQGNLTYAEYQKNGGSNLFITWSGKNA